MWSNECRIHSSNEEPELDPIEAILATHDGNARAAIEDLVHKIQRWRQQLWLASTFPASDPISPGHVVKKPEDKK
ncbi:CUE domain-containing protein [Rhizobium sp. ICMP 5592]|uniref:CUE domain-containing protein n=1 Tax=Rhizobium sp. ICMP 5592 TaxID=2292445 RepID=UPI0012960558|nr:CUE domain-containing protein [Rhizobium sp. ICMP 5592]MQB44108.1 hypothetical protein [Rhizobium sp. ICMP 5592]